MKTKRNVEILLENGIHFSTISKMKPNEVKLLSEKFFKPMGDVEAAKKDVMKAMRAFIKNNMSLSEPDKLSDEQTLDMIKGAARWAKTPNASRHNQLAGELYKIAKPLFNSKPKETKEAVSISQEQDNMKNVNVTGSGKVNVNGINIDLNGSLKAQLPSDAKVEPISEKFESKAQQGFFWAKCNTSKGVKKKKWCEMAKEFSDSTSKKQYKDMPEKTVKRKTEENYEKQLEEQIFNMIEKHIEPSMTKGELLRTIQEKVDKSEKFMLGNPKKNTMFQKNGKMNLPIGRLTSISKEMKEDTKEKEKTKTKPGTKTPTRKNPFKDPNPGVEEQPKANTKEKQAPTKPGTKTPTRRKGNPFKDPNPGVQEQPKAEEQKNDFMSAIESILNK
tara:strand:- start:39 stop:1202 length:1164 start_codon:yes stop_codon:yes gene_type:complete